MTLALSRPQHLDVWSSAVEHCGGINILCGSITTICGSKEPVVTPVLEAIFGNRSAVQVLLFLEAYGSGHAARIATTYGVSVMAIQRQLKRLEVNGVLVSETYGRTRVFEFNIHNPTVRELRTFLASELELLPEADIKAYYQQRQRPRRTDKQVQGMGSVTAATTLEELAALISQALEAT